MISPPHRLRCGARGPRTTGQPCGSSTLDPAFCVLQIRRLMAYAAVALRRPTGGISSPETLCWPGQSCRWA